MNKFLFAIFFLTSGYVCFAADTVIVHKDPRLDVLVSKQSSVNKLTAKMTSSGQYKGYRLQLLNTRSREDAFKLKANMLQWFPDEKTYVLYQSPYFKVRIGNFIKQADAIAFKNKLVKKYPQSAYVVEDIIEYNPDNDDDPSLN